MIPQNTNGRLRNLEGLSAARFSVIMQRFGADRLTWIRVLRIEQGLLSPTKSEVRLWKKIVPGVVFDRVRAEFKRKE